MKIKLYIYIFAIFFALTACSDELEQTNPNETATDNFWENLTQTNKGINSTLSALRNPYLLNINVETCRSDEGYPGYGRPAPQFSNKTTSWYYKSFTSSNSSLEDNWEAFYNVIFRSNQVIEALNKLDSKYKNDEEWPIQMGEARFLRGLMYFWLHSAYNHGSVPIFNKVSKELSNFYPPVSSADSVKSFYLADLKYAYKNLPSSWGDSDLGRPTAGAAATFLGKSYLYENDYDNAITYFKDVIDNSSYGYRLAPADYMFNSNVEFNSESIFEISYNSNVNPEVSKWSSNSNKNILGLYTKNISFGFFLPAWLTYAYRCEKQDPLAPGYDASQMLSKRARAMVAIKGDHTPYYGDTTEIARLKNGVPHGFGYYKKYTSHDILNSYSPQETDGTSKNVVVERLSNVYLMYAECMIKKGDVTTALDYINRIRKRWGLVLRGPVVDASRTYDGKTYSADELMNVLMYNERPLELSSEGFETRWCDLRRWGVLKHRFEDLASQTYYLVDYDNIKPSKKYVKVESELTDKERTSLYNDLIINYEYVKTANNYSEEVNSYLPLPANETSINPNIN